MSSKFSLDLQIQFLKNIPSIVTVDDTASFHLDNILGIIIIIIIIQ